MTEYCFGVRENDGLELVANEVSADPIGLDGSLAYKDESVLLPGPTRVGLPFEDVRWETAVTNEDFPNKEHYEAQVGSEWCGIQESIYTRDKNEIVAYDIETGD